MFQVLRALANPLIGGRFNPDRSIPRAVLKQARGVLILTTLAGGAVVSGMVGHSSSRTHSTLVVAGSILL